MSVLAMCMYVYHMYEECPRRPVAGKGSHGTWTHLSFFLSFFFFQLINELYWIYLQDNGEGVFDQSTKDSWSVVILKLETSVW